ncbi:hypothetical protein CVIRNUC_008797 [Coccomyxa viridis]|uniref:Uncharacterized protein n=1 Tax=Coccomyxa viridis TaxID=1274662 RepID=A0AAV1IFX7_9CHLO|nr:hypothetical protein CVIRNUC_008797 [Coccomyxa viridis]
MGLGPPQKCYRWRMSCVGNSHLCRTGGPCRSAQTPAAGRVTDFDYQKSVTSALQAMPRLITSKGGQIGLMRKSSACLPHGRGSAGERSPECSAPLELQRNAAARRQPRQPGMIYRGSAQPRQTLIHLS